MALEIMGKIVPLNGQPQLAENRRQEMWQGPLFQVPIPAPLRSAWGLSTADESPTPEITGTNPSNPSIIQLLTRPDRSRSPPAGLAPPSGSSTTGHSSSLHRGPIFRPGTFGLQPDIEQSYFSHGNCNYGCLKGHTGPPCSLTCSPDPFAPRSEQSYQ